jgi:hypothetical protein
MSATLETRYPFGPDVARTFTASGWELFKAKLFGQKFEERSGPYTIVAYYYKGKLYVTRLDAL